MTNQSPTTTTTTPLGIDWLSIIILTLPSLFWAGNFVFGRAVHELIPPMTLSFGRWFIANIILTPFALKYLIQDRALYWQYRWRILILSLLGATAFNSLVYLGLQSTTATNGVLLNSFAPMLIILWGVLFYQQRTSVIQLTGLFVSFMGVLAIVLQGNWTNLLALNFTKGDLIILIAVICWSFYTLWLRFLPPQMNKVGFTIIQFIIAAITIFPFAVAEHLSGKQPIWTPLSITAMTYIGIFPSILAFLLYTFGVARIGAARAGLFLHLMPVFGALLSMIFLKEVLHSYHLIGIGAIFIGIALSNYGTAKTAPLSSTLK